ncbi:hypothetical protein BJP36_39980 [Moorena producens JHB]|uniref:Uncharacterized protein n=1 Tax=Moorena producens (strain JHB) TaxID=1454205 RepID=A0A9Q9SRW0_MOOP1|nr:hypothetical protein [Moorena producens]WAN68557.1 hypothetical protein BJP36_39980 [Moorena producens JHB]
MLCPKLYFLCYIAFFILIRYTVFFPYCLLPIAYCLFPIAYSLKSQNCVAHPI